MTGRTVNINLMQIISLYDKLNFHFFAGCCFGGRVLAAITLAAETVKSILRIDDITFSR